MREPGSDGKPQCHVFKKISDNMHNDPVRSIIHHFTWKLLENMTGWFPHNTST